MLSGPKYIPGVSALKQMREFTLSVPEEELLLMMLMSMAKLIVPKLVREHVLLSAKDKEFLYIT